MALEATEAVGVGRATLGLTEEVGHAVAVDHVDVGSNRVRIDLVCPTVAAGVTTIAFEEQSGWILASVARAGWTIKTTLDPKVMASAKAALETYVRCLALELGPRGYRVNLLKFSTVVTPAVHARVVREVIQPVINGMRLPVQDVTWGEDTTDEMCVSFVQIALPVALKLPMNLLSGSLATQ